MLSPLFWKVWSRHVDQSIGVDASIQANSPNYTALERHKLKISSILESMSSIRHLECNLNDVEGSIGYGIVPFRLAVTGGPEKSSIYHYTIAASNS